MDLDYCFHDNIIRNKTLIKCIQCNMILAVKEKNAIPYLALDGYKLDFLQSNKVTNPNLRGCIFSLKRNNS